MKRIPASPRFPFPGGPVAVAVAMCLIGTRCGDDGPYFNCEGVFRVDSHLLADFYFNQGTYWVYRRADSLSQGGWVYDTARVNSVNRFVNDKVATVPDPPCPEFLKCV